MKNVNDAEPGTKPAPAITPAGGQLAAPADEPWTRTADRSVWRARRGGLVLTVTRLAGGGWQATAENANVTERSPVTATRLAAQQWADNRAGSHAVTAPHQAAAGMEPLGPFETDAEARRHPAVQAVYAAARASHRRGVLSEGSHRLLDEACTFAGVELGAYDHRIILWLAGWEPEICMVVAGLITRGRQGTVLNPASTDTIRGALADAVAYRSALSSRCADCTAAAPEGCADHQGDAGRATAYEAVLRNMVTSREV